MSAALGLVPAERPSGGAPHREGAREGPKGVGPRGSQRVPKGSILSICRNITKIATFTFLILQRISTFFTFFKTFQQFDSDGPVALLF
jgi:hypothetical protein